MNRRLVIGFVRCLSRWRRCCDAREFVGASERSPSSLKSVSDLLFDALVGNAARY